MAQVPYTGVPAVEPTDQPIRPAVPAEAFGAGVARAVSGFGGTLEHVGNELWGRAVALKQLDNETEAREADTQYMIQAGQLHAEFNAKEGQARVAAFPKYQQDLQEARQKLRGSLSNDMARRMYDSSSLSTMGRSIFNGAGAAATAHRQWVVGSANSQMELDAKFLEDNPSEGAYDEAARKTRINAKTLAAAHDFEEGGPQEQLLEKKAVSKLRRSQIYGVNKKDPLAAGDMITKYRADLSEEDYNFLVGTVQAQSRSIGSVNAANEVYENGRATDTKPQVPLGTMEEQAKELYRKRHPDDPIGEQHAVAAVRGRFNQDKYAHGIEDTTNKQIITGAIIAGAKNEQELYSDPRVAAARDALPDTTWKAGIPAMINRINDAKNRQTNIDNYVTLEGMRVGNPIKFLNEDISKWQLSTGDMKKFITAQQKIKDAPQADPRVQQFISWMKPLLGSEMRAAGVINPPTRAEGAGVGDDYDKFMGLVSVGIQDYIEEHGKPPKGNEAVKEIGQRVLRGVAEPHFFGLLSSDVPYFKKPLNTDEFEAFKKQRTDEAIAKGETAPSDAEAERMYRTMDYLRFYKKSKDSGK